MRAHEPLRLEYRKNPVESGGVDISVHALQLVIRIQVCSISSCYLCHLARAKHGCALICHRFLWINLGYIILFSFSYIQALYNSSALYILCSTIQFFLRSFITYASSMFNKMIIRIKSIIFGNFVMGDLSKNYYILYNFKVCG